MYQSGTGVFPDDRSFRVQNRDCMRGLVSGSQTIKKYDRDINARNTKNQLLLHLCCSFFFSVIFHFPPASFDVFIPLMGLPGQGKGRDS